MKCVHLSCRVLNLATDWQLGVDRFRRSLIFAETLSHTALSADGG